MPTPVSSTRQPGGVWLAAQNAVDEDGEGPRLEQVDPDAGQQETHRKADSPGVRPEVAERSRQQTETRDGRRGQVARPHRRVHRSLTGAYGTTQVSCRAGHVPPGLETRLLREGPIKRVSGRTLSRVIRTRNDRHFRGRICEADGVCRNHRVNVPGNIHDRAGAGPDRSRPVWISRSGTACDTPHPLARARSVLRSHRERAIAHADDREISADSARRVDGRHQTDIHRAVASRCRRS